MSPAAVLKGLLFSPAATMWRLREKGSLWMSCAAAWILGGFGLHQAHFLDAITGHTQPLWCGWAAGLVFFPLVFTASMAAYHAAGTLVWRWCPDPVKPATLRDMLRLGGYLALPSSLIGLTANTAILPAAASGSAAAARAVFLGLIPLYLAGLAWSLFFTLRLLRTVYLIGWENAVAIWVIAGILTAILAIASIGGAKAHLDFDYHGAHGADPRAVEVLHSLPGSDGKSFGTNAWVTVLRFRGEPRTGDLVAYYTGRDAPHVPRNGGLPGPIRVGRVLGIEGQIVEADASLRLLVDGEEVAWAAGDVFIGTGGRVPARQVAIVPDDVVGPLGLESYLVPRASVAGLVPEASRVVHLVVAWLLR